MLLKSPMCKSCIHLENLVMLERVGGLRRGLLLVNGYNLHSSIRRQSWLHQNSWYRLWKKSVCHWEPGMIVVVVFHQLLLLLSMLWRRQNRSRFSLRYCILINVRIDYTFWCAPRLHVRGTPWKKMTKNKMSVCKYRQFIQMKCHLHLRILLKLKQAQLGLYAVEQQW